MRWTVVLPALLVCSLAACGRSWLRDEDGGRVAEALRSPEKSEPVLLAGDRAWMIRKGALRKEIDAFTNELAEAAARSEPWSPGSLPGTGDVVAFAYLLDPGALEKERRALLEALVAKRIYPALPRDELARFLKALYAWDRQALEAYRDRIEPEEFAEMLANLDREPAVFAGERPSTGVRRFEGNRVLEIAYPEGTLRIDRSRGGRAMGARYTVAYTTSPRGFGHKGVTFLASGTKATPGIETAWRSLERAAAAHYDYSVSTDETGPLRQSVLARVRKLAYGG